MAANWEYSQLTKRSSQMGGSAAYERELKSESAGIAIVGLVTTYVLLKALEKTRWREKCANILTRFIGRRQENSQSFEVPNEEEPALGSIEYVEAVLLEEDPENDEDEER